MDDTRFDHLTRLLGGRISRQETVRGLLGAVIAGVAGGLSAGDAEAGEKHRRRRRRKRQTRPCLTRGQVCKQDEQCCSGRCGGMVCKGPARKKRPKHKDKDKKNDRKKDRDRDPKEPRCVRFGQACGSKDTCCRGACIEGACRCQSDDDCKQQQFCSDGTCLDKLPHLEPCERDNQCESGICDDYLRQCAANR